MLDTKSIKSHKSHKSSKSKDKSKSKDDKKEKSSSKDKSKEKDKSKDKEKDKSKDKSKVEDKIKSKDKDKDKKDKEKKKIDQESQNVSEFSQLQPQEKTENVQMLLDQAKDQEKICIHHGQPLVLFCESCEEPICRQCSILGPHNNQLHRLNNIAESYKTRILKLSQQINGNLLEKKSKLLGQIYRIEYRIEEIRYVKTLIERDIRSEYSGILERLKSAEGLKTAVLQHEMAELQKDLDRINDLGNSYLELTSNQNDPINFLVRSRTLYENLEFLVAKPFKVSIDVYPYDLPRELTQKRQMFEKAKAYEQILQFKDEVIFKLMLKKKEYEDKIKTELDQTVHVEINEWAKLTEKFANELKKYQLICFYCGQTLDKTSINKKCKGNRKIPEQNFQGYTDRVPDQKQHGTRRHYFGQPNEQLMKFQQFQPDFRKDSSKKPPIDPQSNLKMFFEVQIAKMKKTIIDNNINLQDLFMKHDKNQKKVLNTIQFAYILNDVLAIDPQDIDKVIKFLDPNNTKQIQYEYLLKSLSDSNYIDQLASSNVKPQSQQFQQQQQFLQENDNIPIQLQSNQ